MYEILTNNTIRWLGSDGFLHRCIVYDAPWGCSTICIFNGVPYAFTETKDCMWLDRLTITDGVTHIRGYMMRLSCTVTHVGGVAYVCSKYNDRLFYSVTPHGIQSHIAESHGWTWTTYDPISEQKCVFRLLNKSGNAEFVTSNAQKTPILAVYHRRLEEVFGSVVSYHIHATFGYVILLQVWNPENKWRMLTTYNRLTHQIKWQISVRATSIDLIDAWFAAENVIIYRDSMGRGMSEWKMHNIENNTGYSVVDG